MQEVTYSYSAEAEAEAVAEMIENGATVQQAQAAIVHTIHGAAVKEEDLNTEWKQIVWTVGTEFGEDTRMWTGAGWITADAL